MLSEIRNLSIWRKEETFRLLSKVERRSDTFARMSHQVKALLDLGFVKNWDSQILVKEKGKKFMFQWDFEKFLWNLQDSFTATTSQHVFAWLVKHQFISRTDYSSNWQITPRGLSVR